VAQERREVAAMAVLEVIRHLVHTLPEMAGLVGKGGLYSGRKAVLEDQVVVEL
jgi:hypothetical protein